MNDDAQLSIRSLDAIDIRFDVAGAGSRAYAFVIDWHIRLLAAIVVGVAVGAAPNMLFGAGLSWADDSFYGLIAAGLIYFLYHPVLEIAMSGQTPGKRWAGLRIVSSDGTPVGTASLVVRNLFRLVDSLPAFYALGFTMMVLSKRSLRLGDLAAGTLVVHEALARGGELLAAARLSSRLQPGAQQLLEEWLARWGELDQATRDEIACKALIREGLAAQIEGLSGDALRVQVGRLVNA
ncbi:MAG: RDD family protein [Panacagrimonas sp.]